MKNYLTLLVFLSILQCSHAQWSQITSPYSANFWAIKFFDQNIGYIGGNTVILKTTDGGNSWTSTPISNFMINSFSFPSTTVGYYGASNNIVAKTTDQGESWANQNPNASPFAILSVCFLTSSVGYAVGEAGVIRKTTTGGTSWVTQSSGLSTSINEVYFFDVNTGLFIGESGKIKRTTNGGTSWSTISSGTSGNLYDLSFVNANTGYIAGASGKILKTTNGGTSWISLTTGTTQWLYAICFKNLLVGYAGGANGTIIKTTDGGATWQPEVSGIPQEINDIVYVNNRFIAVATQGKIITDVSTTGINKNQNNNSSIAIFPNPASDFVSIHFDNIKSMKTTIDIIDMKSVLMKSVLLEEKQSTINIDDLSNGVYMVIIKSKDLKENKRLIIQR